MSIAIEIKGLDEMKRAFNNSPAEAVKAFDVAIQRSIFLIENNSKQVTPVDTGFLRETGMVTSFEALIGRLDNTAPYATYVHDGTKKMEARPFFDQGIEASQADVDKFFDEALSNLVDSI